MERNNKRRLVFGGMATAMVVVLMTGITMTQLENFSETVDMGGVSVTAPPGTDAASPAYIAAVESRNEAELEHALRTGGSTLPVPVETPSERLQLPRKSDKAEDPLHRWRRLQEEKTVAKMKKEMAGRDEVGGMAASVPSTREMIAPVSPLVIGDDVIAPPSYKDEGRDKFEDFDINPFKSVAAEPVSTFSSDVDTASYSFVRRQLNHGVMPQKDAVRVEEMINYFDYHYPVPDSRAEPFKPSVVVTDSPWAEGKKLLHIGIKGYEITGEKPRSNLVFLLDVSGSMNDPEKLPLLKNSMKLLLDTLGPDDTVAIAVYAGAAGTALEPTKVSEKSKILRAIDNLNAGGSTAGAEGIELAYQLAGENFDEEAVNRVILATDGDFNVGITNPEELQDFVERKRKTGIYLSVLGFGQGNYNDSLMQTLAQNGNGVAAYIDSLNEARKVLVEEASSSLFPIAKDVKFQVEFNPKAVAEYRLIGYETRHLEREDFNNDAVDAGDMGSGHTVTAIYEFVPVGSEAASVDPLRYGTEIKPGMDKPKLYVSSEPDQAQEYAFLKIRYKLPDESKSKLITTPVTVENDVSRLQMDEMPAVVFDTRFATAVAAFGQILKGGQYTGDYTYDDVIALAQAGKGPDPYGYRAEFIQMVRMAKSLDR